MMKLTVSTENSYNIYMDDNYEGLRAAFDEAGLINRKICVVTDSNVAELYLKDVNKILSQFSENLSSYVFKAGEESKILSTVEDIYGFLLENKFDRRSVIVALGGGVTGDMAGFAAATYMRGVSYVQMPTTLLSQVDSSVGGKVGVDHYGVKNLVGAFYQPRLVYINTNTLKTLPSQQFASGMAEAVKHGVILDLQYFDYIYQNRELIKLLNASALTELIYGSCKIKSTVVSEDEKEQGIRELLNFGHTFGHAVESLSDYSILHGHCVGIGMLCAMRLCVKRELLPESELLKLKELLMYFDISVNVPDISADLIYEKMLTDKKNKENKINLVLLNRLGGAYVENNATREEILDAVEYTAAAQGECL